MQCVYVIEAEGADMVKIGVATAIAKRLSGLQTASPLPLAFCFALPGGRKLEQRLHARFARARIRGEWFQLSAISEDLLKLAQGWHSKIFACKGCAKTRTQHVPTPYAACNYCGRPAKKKPRKPPTIKKPRKRRAPGRKNKRRRTQAEYIAFLDSILT